MKKTHEIVDSRKYGTPIADIVRKNLRNPDYRRHFLLHFVRIEIAAAIKNMRLDKGLTQKQLAARAGVPQPQIARLESIDDERIPRLDFIIKLIAAMGGSISLVSRPTPRSTKGAREIALV